MLCGLSLHCPESIHKRRHERSEIRVCEREYLDGTLITDRMLEARQGDEPMMVSRTEYERSKAEFDALVDFAIVPTIPDA